MQRSIPVLIEQDLPVSDPVQKANIFNSHFADQCTLPDNAENHNLPDTNFETDRRLDILNFQPCEVKKLLNSVDPNKASGPDNISNLVHKEVAREVCTPLCKIFNQSVIAGVYHNYWKSSHVILIHKKDYPKNKSNYRPISLLCNISKIFERLVHQKLYSFLQHNTLLSSNNSGFHSGDSTINQLTVLIIFTKPLTKAKIFV